MAFKTNLQISGNPEFNVNIKTAPLDFQVGGEATLAFTAQPIKARIDKIPLKIRLPFSHDYVVAATIGPFDMSLDEINATARTFDIDIAGIIGKDGIEADVSGEVRCCMKIDVNAQLPDKMLGAVINAVLEDA